MFSKYKSKRNLAVLVVGLVLIPVVSFGSSLFFVDEGGNIGIGNSDPQHKLDVAGAMYSRLVTATSTSVDWNAGNVQMRTLSSNPTFTFSNGQAGGEYKLILNQDATGGRVAMWPANVIWSGGSAPMLSSSANKTDIMDFIYDGSRYLGSYNLNYSASSSLLTSLVSYWKFDESSGNAFDSGSEGNTLVNTSTSFGTGKINNGAVFNGTTSKFISTANLGISGSEPRTFSMWVKMASQPSSSAQTFFNFGTLAANNGQFLSYVDASGTKKIQYGGYANDYEVNQTLSNSTWYFLTFTFDGTTAEVFVNGSSLGTSNRAGWNSSDTQLTLGVFLNGIGQFLNGELDEVGVWSRALSNSEITTLYNSGAGLQYPF